MLSQKTTIVYIPRGIDCNERWEAVEDALRVAGISDIRPAPMPAQQFQPRHARQSLPVMLCSAEV